MYYLRCDGCGYPNEVSSEFQVFCSNCNKKLYPNFSAWRAVNPGKGFEDFKKEVCLTDVETLQKTPGEKGGKRSTPKPGSGKGKKNGGSWSLWIFIVVCAFFLVFLTMFGTRALIEMFKARQGQLQTNDAAWITTRIGGSGFQLETPFRLNKQEIPIPEESADMIEKMDLYQSPGSGGLNCVVSHIVYHPDIGDIKLGDLVSGSMAELRQQPGLGNLQPDEQMIQTDGVSGMRLDG